MKKLRFAVFGCGFWSHFQIPGWNELEGIELVAVYNRTSEKAEQVAKKFNVPRFYDNPEALLDNEQLDFIDIITDVDTHPQFVKMAAERGINVICQKPMAPTLAAAEEMTSLCRQKGVKYYIHENFRWQAPVRKLKSFLTAGVIGVPFKARLSFCCSFPVFKNQPFLAEVENFIISDVGSHTLDIARFLFGEADNLYCRTKSVNPGIKGEDVANILLEMKNGVNCFVELSYASILENEKFPETFILVEGEKGSIFLGPDGEIRITTKEGTKVDWGKPVMYDWVDPDYAVVHSSIVDTNRDILEDMLGRTNAETTGEDNLNTVRLVFASYESARRNTVIRLDEFTSQLKNKHLV